MSRTICRLVKGRSIFRIFFLRSDEIREQIVSLKKEYSKDKKVKNQILEKEETAKVEKKVTNELMEQYESEQKKYSHMQKDLPKKGALR